MDDQQNQINYQYRLTMPQSELQFNMLTTESTWGMPDMNPEIRDALTEVNYAADEQGEIIKDEGGNPVVLEKKQLWDRFSIYTRDVRLANIDGQELVYVNYMLDLAFQLLQKDMYRAASLALGYAATVLETSQSKKGFLRRRMNTLTSENIHAELEPPKKKLFSKNGE